MLCLVVKWLQFLVHLIFSQNWEALYMSITVKFILSWEIQENLKIKKGSWNHFYTNWYRSKVPGYFHRNSCVKYILLSIQDSNMVLKRMLRASNYAVFNPEMLILLV